MGTVYVNECVAGQVSQEWNVMADGRIALVPSSPRTSLENFAYIPKPWRQIHIELIP